MPDEPLVVIGIDPGPEESAIVEWNGGKVLSARDISNQEVLTLLENCKGPVAIERVRGFGLKIGNDVLDTVEWIGRFHQAKKTDCYLIDRKEVVHHLCNTAKGGDTEVRQALVYRIGEQGTKKNPGPLYGVTKHRLPALAVAVTWYDIFQFVERKAQAAEILSRIPTLKKRTPVESAA